MSSEISTRAAIEFVALAALMAEIYRSKERSALAGTLPLSMTVPEAVAGWKRQDRIDRLMSR